MGHFVMASDLEKVEEWLVKLKRDPHSSTLQRELLSHFRATGLRRSDLVHQYGSELLQKPRGLGDELWLITEQVIMARLDLGKVEEAKFLYFQLKHQFGNASVRVQILRGMIYEAEGDWNGARQFYQTLTQSNPTNQFLLKRRICVEKASGRVAQAISLLTQYLDLFSVDVNAWEELGELHIKNGSLREAAYCYEELLLSEPENFRFYTSVAEIYYTLGGKDNFLLARKYYSHSLLLNKDQNLRSLYGLHATTTALTSIKGGSTPENQELLDWVVRQICDTYHNNAEFQEFIGKFVVA